MVTVTVSMDCLPLAAVITSSPHLRSCRAASVLPLLLHGAVRHAAGHGTGDQSCHSSYARQGTGNAIAADQGHCTRRAAKAVVAGDGLLIVRSRRGRGPGVRVVVHSLVAQRGDRERVAVPSR